MDCFDQLPDALIMLIFDAVSDVKSLIRCRSVSKRFNSLVPQTESLTLQVDEVISPESESDSLFISFIKIFFKSLHDLLTTAPTPKPQTQTQNLTLTRNSPAQILSKFQRVKDLRIELPGGDLNLDKGITVKWRAEFGSSLRSCVIIGFKSGSTAGDDEDIAGGLKMRVMWTISSLIAASARHLMLEEIVRDHQEMESLVLVDREGEGTVVMDKDGVRECRLETAHVREEDRWGMGRRNRTMVPSVRMRMRHVPRLILPGGISVEGATLVVVRANAGRVDDVEDAELALGAFGDNSYREAVQEMLKSRSYMLEMNSF